MPFINMDEIEEKEIVSGFKAKFIHSENMTVAYWTITAGSSLPEHSHKHEQVANLIKGKFEFILDGEKKIIEPGTNVVIPSNVKHSGKALTDCFIIDIFYPIRKF